MRGWISASFTLTLTLAPTTIMGAVGCAPAPVDDAKVASVDADVPVQLGPIQGAIDGRVDGAIGPAEVANNATEMSTYDDGYYITVETVVAFPERAIMTLLSVSNGADLFVAGNGGRWSLNEDPEGGPRVTMLGCVGDEVGIYNEYDKPADELDLSIDEPSSELPNEVDVTVHARWYDRDEHGEHLETYRDAVTTFTLVR